MIGRGRPLFRYTGGPTFGFKRFFFRSLSSFAVAQQTIPLKNLDEHPSSRFSWVLMRTAARTSSYNSHRSPS